MNTYDEAVQTLRAPLPTEPSLRDFVRFATLAPNSHNTQPWTFGLGNNHVEIRPDLSRRTPAADPDDHHVVVTLGCAAESLLLAARSAGRSGEVAIEGQSPDETVVRVFLGDGAVSEVELANAILTRQSTRSEYDGQALSSDELRLLETAATQPGVEVLFITERPRMEDAIEFVIAGNSAQMDDPAWVQELKDWLRFNARAALQTRDGLFSKCSGNPTMPDWISGFMFDRVFKKNTENDKYARQIRSSSGIAVFIAEEESPRGWVDVGRCFNRFALQATTMGIRHGHVNMPIEVVDLRPEFASWLGIPGRRPDLVIRFGKAPLLPMSIRRPIDDVIIA
ncbi:Acg family FMN-binding oxidoreductase [Hyphobacterium sp.]|uniref:Acg family FMN-binding oxidoreductase n=1 Tax=Hyphobacterium sp. TaxID=2004662 RepID=UPI003BA9B89B